MSSRARALAAAVFALAAAATARGQSVRALELRVDSLAAAARTADAALQAYDDSVSAQDAKLEPLAAGAFHLLTTPAITPLAREAAGIAENDLRRELGPAGDRVAKYRFVVRATRHGESRLSAEDVVVAIWERSRVTECGKRRCETIVGAESEQWADENRSDAKMIAATLERRAVALLTAETGLAFQNWLQSNLPTDSLTPVDWSQRRLFVVSSPTVIGHRCYEGSLADCEVALGLKMMPDPILHWYNAQGRREVVRRIVLDENALPHGFRTLAAERAGSEQCLGGDDRGCVAVLRWIERSGQIPWNYGRWVRGDPLPVELRLSLVREAMQLGGPRAIVRLLDASGGPRERLAAAAGVPIDSVVSAWQARIRYTRVPSEAMSPLLATTSVLWILACAGAALRSSRWR